MKKKNLNGTRLSGLFSSLRSAKKKALVTFITAGDPHIKATSKVVTALESAGADIIELGMPFSDPMADGPAIQLSSERAIKSGTTVASVLECVKSLRKKTDIPIILFGYYNPIFSYGPARFARDAKRAGADGVLVVDLPPEESDELKSELEGQGLHLIYLLTPTSDTGRIKTVLRVATGFIYYVSVTGVTGARKSLDAPLKKRIEKIKRMTDIPVVVGFGISTPAQAASVSRWADGVVVGSAIVKVIEKYGHSMLLPRKVSGLVRGLKRAMDKC